MYLWHIPVFHFSLTFKIYVPGNALSVYGAMRSFEECISLSYFICFLFVLFYSYFTSYVNALMWTHFQPAPVRIDRKIGRGLELWHKFRTLRFFLMSQKKKKERKKLKIFSHLLFFFTWGMGKTTS